MEGEQKIIPRAERGEKLNNIMQEMSTEGYEIPDELRNAILRWQDNLFNPLKNRSLEECLELLNPNHKNYSDKVWGSLNAVWGVQGLIATIIKKEDGKFTPEINKLIVDALKFAARLRYKESSLEYFQNFAKIPQRDLPPRNKNFVTGARDLNILSKNVPTLIEVAKRYHSSTSTLRK